MEIYGASSPARCFTGSICALGILLTLVSVLFFGQCVARATPHACSMHGGLMAVNAALTGFILIITGGICLAIYDCFRVELPRSTTASPNVVEERWKPRFLLAIPQAQAHAQAALLAEGGGKMARSDRTASADLPHLAGLPA